MRRAIVYLFTLVFGVFGSIATAQTIVASAAASPPPRGTLYKVTSKDHTAYLFGTIHVGKPGFFPLEPKVTQALAQATKIAVELDVRKSEPFQAALKKHGMLAKGETLAQYLPEQTLQQLMQVLARFQLPFDNVKHMKPWLVANLLLGLDLEAHGYHRTDGVEFFLLAAAGAQSKAVYELESADYQLALFDSMSMPEQEQYLRENLTELQDGTALKKAEELIDAWSAGDGKLAAALLRESRDEQTTTADFTQRTLLDRRNPDMTSKVEALLKSDKVVFVGVGLLHLLGDNGVPALLRQRGYAVEKLY